MRNFVGSGSMIAVKFTAESIDQYQFWRVILNEAILVPFLNATECFEDCIEAGNRIFFSITHDTFNSYGFFSDAIEIKDISGDVNNS